MNTQADDVYVEQVRSEAEAKRRPMRWYQKSDVQAFIDLHVKRICLPGEIIYMRAASEEEFWFQRNHNGDVVKDVADVVKDVADVIMVGNEDGSSEYTFSIKGVVDILLEMPNGAGSKEIWKRLTPLR